MRMDTAVKATSLDTAPIDLPSNESSPMLLRCDTQVMAMAAQFFFLAHK